MDEGDKVNGVRETKGEREGGCLSRVGTVCRVRNLMTQMTNKSPFKDGRDLYIQVSQSQVSGTGLFIRSEGKPVMLMLRNAINS